MKKIESLALALCLFATSAAAHAEENAFFRFGTRLSANSLTLPAATFTQTLDHFDSTDTRTFQERYWVDSGAAKSKDAPVVLLVCGEGNCQYELEAWPHQLAQALGAHFVALEHRFYGESQPFSDVTPGNLTPDNLKYLSIEQAIEDLASFQKWMATNQGLTGKWISFGGSYAAGLASIYRLKHPELVSGAIASSQYAIFNNGTIDSDRVAAQTAGHECTTLYRAFVLDPILKAMGNPQLMDPIKGAFDSADIPDDLDFLGTVTGMAIFDIQGFGAREFCASLNDPKDPLVSFANHLRRFASYLGTRMSYWSYAGVQSPNGKNYEGFLGTRQWMYQSCTEVGLFTDLIMMANPNTQESLSSTLTDALPSKYCEAYYGVRAPAVDEMNEKYYKPLLDPSTSNILFVSGSNDPACFPYSISKENGNATNPNTVAFTVQGGSHCQDYTPPKDSDSESLREARRLEVELAKRWTSN